MLKELWKERQQLVEEQIFLLGQMVIVLEKVHGAKGGVQPDALFFGMGLPVTHVHHLAI